MKERIYYIQDAIGIGHSIPESKLADFRKENAKMELHKDEYRQRMIDSARRTLKKIKDRSLNECVNR